MSALPPWHAHPDVWLLLAALAGGYFWAIRRLGPRSVHPDDPIATRGQIASFSAGVLALWVAADWPTHDLSERFLFSIHMVQHTLISLVAPPLLLLGTPDWLLRRLVSPRPIRAFVKTMARPFVALLTFNGVIVVTHWPVLVDAAVGSEPLHFALHAVLFASATLMWWPVISPLPEMPGLSYPGRMLYLFLQSVVPTVPASFLTFGSHPFYSAYVAAPRIWGISALTDQLVAGLIMKLVGGAILWVGIAICFFKWWGREQIDGWDELAIGRVEREIRSGLARR
jgi:putative membrane protein